MSTQTIRPGLTAAMRVGRELLAAGWKVDSVDQLADGSTERHMLHPSGREITAITDGGRDSTELTMTGLSLEQVAGAVTGAGLAPAVEPTGSHAKLVAGLRALADFIEANPTMPAFTYPRLVDSGPVRESDADGVERVHHVAALLGVEVTTSRSGHMSAERQFAGLRLRISHVPDAAMEDHAAHMSYVDNVKAGAR